MNDLFSKLNGALADLTNLQVPLTTLLFLGGVLYVVRRVLLAVPALSLGWTTGLLRLVPAGKSATVFNYTLGGALVLAGAVTAGSTISFSSRPGKDTGPAADVVYEKAIRANDPSIAAALIKDSRERWEECNKLNTREEPKVEKPPENLSVVPGLPRGGAVLGGFMMFLLGFCLIGRTANRDKV